MPGESGTYTALRYDNSPLPSRSMGFGPHLEDVRFIATISEPNQMKPGGGGERGR